MNERRVKASTSPQHNVSGLFLYSKHVLYSNMRAGDTVTVRLHPVVMDDRITVPGPAELREEVHYTIGDRKGNLGPRKEAVMGEPVGYLFSHPYSRESVLLHRVSGHTTGSDVPKAKEATEEDLLDHDQLMEKYVIHDCAAHPDWRGKGVASKLLQTMEESLVPGGDSSKGAPNLKEIVLVSTQGSRPFWEHNGGYQVVADHDMDLSVYGDSAFLMTRSFTF